jgi:hypothetical protein
VSGQLYASVATPRMEAPVQAGRRLLDLCEFAVNQTIALNMELATLLTVLSQLISSHW